MAVVNGHLGWSIGGAQFGELNWGSSIPFPPWQWLHAITGYMQSLLRGLGLDRGALTGERVRQSCGRPRQSRQFQLAEARSTKPAIRSLHIQAVAQNRRRIPGGTPPIRCAQPAGRGSGQRGCTPPPRLDASSQRWMGAGKGQRCRLRLSIARWRVKPVAAGWSPVLKR